jgi:hypothetical protein
MKKIFITLVLLIISVFAKETNTQPMGYNLSNLESIKNCGTWYPKDKDNTREGDFRVIESYSNAQSYLYIDIKKEMSVIKVFQLMK